jgi:hypothetical protein
LNALTPDGSVTPESRPLSISRGSEIAAGILTTDTATSAAQTPNATVSFMKRVPFHTAATRRTRAYRPRPLDAPAPSSVGASTGYWPRFRAAAARSAREVLM